MKICFATTNSHKTAEIAHALGSSFELLNLKDVGCSVDLPENQVTIAGNSLEKTKYLWDNFHIDCFGDDTGLEVEAIDGEPGVYSARYAGVHGDAEANMNLLLSKMEGKSNRNARFVTVITCIIAGEVTQFEGIVLGKIRTEKSGAEGFGYDPIFEPMGYDVTFAEMSIEQKNVISHRGLAVQKLIVFLKNKWATN
jgi:XTP/dITP diphosphohydrolase